MNRRRFLKRAMIKHELIARLRAIAEEMEALGPQLLGPSPARAAIAQFQELARLSHETRELLLAVRGAERVTQH
jgi:hypothetical protein